MAKANEADIEMSMELCNALETLTYQWAATMPERIERCGEGESEPFDRDNPEQCQRALGYLLDLFDRASLMRVVWGCAVMLDPKNRCVDPDADTIEHHPDVETALAARVPRPACQWHEDMGDVLWWKLPVEEPPWVGTPNDSDWRGYHTHWTPLLVPEMSSEAADATLEPQSA